MVTVQFADSRGKVVQEITATNEHPFFVEGKGWVGAAHLGIGSQIVTRAGPRLIVKSVTPHRRPEGYSVYNFTVGQDHTYFVGAAEGGVWVHNACPELFDNKLPERLARELADAKELGVTPSSVGSPGFDEAIDQGTIKWAVTEDGQLLTVPGRVGNTEIFHSVLTGGNPVQAAGQAEIAGSGGEYYGLEITNHSGHFLPSPDSLQIGTDAFAQHGIVFPE